MPQSPKKNITKLSLKGGYVGTRQRIENTKEAFEENLAFPKPVEYEDIDRAVLEFVKDEIHLQAEGKAAPTFTLFSNQRFSEYTQMWEHSDENGNLYLNFKTVNREKNPKFGGNQGGLWNIPVQRKYTLLQRQVLDDNGTESYEIHTMKQPYAVDLSYTINFVTTTIDYLNKFNQKVN